MSKQVASGFFRLVSCVADMYGNILLVRLDAVQPFDDVEAGCNVHIGLNILYFRYLNGNILIYINCYLCATEGLFSKTVIYYF